MLKNTYVREEPWGFLYYNYKNDEFSAEILQGEEPIPYSPIGIGWIIIGGCNLKCVHCYGNIEQLPNIMLSTTDCLFIADRIIEANIMRVTISGGEPMLRDDIFRIIQKFYDNNISIILGTNGTFIQKENVNNLQMCTKVEISLDANTRNLNNRIRQSRQKSGNAWDEAINAITLCVDHKINLRVLTALNSLNQNSLLGMASLLEYLGVKDWGISWTIPAGRAFPIYDWLKPNEKIIENNLVQIRQMHPSMNIRYSNRTLPKFNKFYCLILPDGQIGTEDINLGRKIYFGSIFTNPISLLWNDQNYNLKRHFEKWVGDRISYISNK